MKRPTLKIIIAIVLSLLVLGAGAYLLTHRDMTGVPYSEIEAYCAQHPNVKISYTVTIDGGNTPLELTNESAAAELTALAQADSMIAQADYLQHLRSISFSDCVMDADTAAAMSAAFPNADITYPQITLLGKAYPADTKTVELQPMSTEEFVQAAKELVWFPNLTEVTVTSPEDSVYTADHAAVLAAALPDVTVNMTFRLFGREIATDMETLEYFKTDIGGDAGLDVIRSVMPIMDKLTYLKLDWCGTSNEATAALRDELAERCKVVWRIFFGNYNCLTDTYKIWAQSRFNDETLEVLKYCTEVRYLDLGHCTLTSCEFVRNMPHLDAAIFGDGRLKSLEPLRDCKSLTFLEIFTTHVTDLSPLADLKNLQYLNMSNIEVDDISPLYHLDNLIMVNSTMNHIPQDQIDEFKRLQPQCTANFFTTGDPTGFGWRWLNGRNNPRYELLRKQIGYSMKDWSRYPTGYVTEEITYESTGITPPQVSR